MDLVDFFQPPTDSRLTLPTTVAGSTAPESLHHRRNSCTRRWSGCAVLLIALVSIVLSSTASIAQELDADPVRKKPAETLGNNNQSVTNGVAKIGDDDFLAIPSDGSTNTIEPNPDTSAPIQEQKKQALGTDPPQSKTQDETKTGDSTSADTNTSWSFRKLTDRKNLPSTVQMVLSFASISLVPAILLMTTCFIRIVVVLGILRQAIGLQQLPPAQVTTALALMMTFLVMSPYWAEVKKNAIDPYSAEGSTMSWDEAWTAGVTPIKKFMWNQIDAADNQKDYWLFYDYLPDEEKSQEPTSIETVPLKVLMPAFMISELKVAFLIGAQIYLPFLIIDILVASFSNTMGLLMLPPTVASLPLKLILFVLVDGWNLVVGLLLNSFVPLS